MHVSRLFATTHGSRWHNAFHCASWFSFNRVSIYPVAHPLVEFSQDGERAVVAWLTFD